MLRQGLLFLLIFFSFNSRAQLLWDTYNRESNYETETELNSTAENFHTSIKPFARHEVRKALKDTTSVRKSSFTINPIGEVTAGYELNRSESYIRATGGLTGSFDHKEKISGQVYYYFGTGLLPSYQDSLVKSTSVVPNEGRSYGGMSDHNWSVLSFNINYKPSKYFTFQAGKGKFFLGEGYRSLLLSDVAPVYPYFAIHTSVWKFKYLNLYTLMDDLQFNNKGELRSGKKFTMMHYLSWNVHRNFNISFFEAEIHQTRDTAAFLGLEPNYLNPVIFYRPVEYSMGSADNALLGGSMKFRFFRDHNLFFQLMLDEFLLSELKARRGWWANKFAWQLGYKYFDAFAIKGLRLQAEYNYIRPFTYSHGNVSQNYGHQQHSLAHPLGANLTEIAGILAYSKGSWLLESKVTATVYGGDDRGRNYGQNIYRSYTTRDKDYGNTTGQGLSSTLMYNQTRLCYLFKRFKVIAEAGIETRVTTGERTNSTMLLFGGIRTPLFNQYRDY